VLLEFAAQRAQRLQGQTIRDIGGETRIRTWSISTRATTCSWGSINRARMGSGTSSSRNAPDRRPPSIRESASGPALRSTVQLASVAGRRRALGGGRGTAARVQGGVASV
jgi:hypothetical protein